MVQLYFQPTQRSCTPDVGFKLAEQLVDVSALGSTAPESKASVATASTRSRPGSSTCASGRWRRKSLSCAGSRAQRVQPGVWQRSAPHVESIPHGFAAPWQHLAASRQTASPLPGVILGLSVLTLRQLVAVLGQRAHRPKLNDEDRSLWITVLRLLDTWRDVLHVIHPGTAPSWGGTEGTRGRFDARRCLSATKNTMQSSPPDRAALLRDRSGLNRQF